MKKYVLIFGFISFLSCEKASTSLAENTKSITTYNKVRKYDFKLNEFQQKISDAALSIVDPEIIYDPTYFKLDYPNGDVPANIGVCTDVVIRTYRKLGIDLQKEVHEDMRENFSEYPTIWGLTKPDKNIDHRRVPNLMTFFSKYGTEKPITKNSDDYLPGDIVSWKLPNGMTHIGVVVSELSKDRERFQVVHNIGSGQIVEDILFDFEIIGHHFYYPN